MKKKAKSILYVVFVLMALAVLLSVIKSVGAFDKGKNDSEKIDNVYEITLSETTKTELGSLTGNTVFSSENGKSILRFVGDGKGTIQPCAGASLEFKNLTIVDASNDVWTDLYGTYLRFGGKITFTNCVFTNSIYLLNNADMVFENCTFTSGKTKHYSVWVADGSAAFNNCTFVGFRGLKVNEFDSHYQQQVNEPEDVETVVVSNCKFDKISEKPGVSIGAFLSLENTSIKLIDNEFIGCEAFETAIDVLTLGEFIEENNKVIYEE